MRHSIHRPHLRPRLARFALVGLLALVAAALTQCRLMEDPVTGLDVRSNTAFSGKKSKCVHQCESVYKDCRKEESERHSDAKRACEKLGKGDKDEKDKKSDERRECRRTEAKYHADQVQACKDAKRKCKENCRYREGAGSAGR